MRKALASLTVLGSLFVPSVAQAAFPTNVFNGTVPCAVQNAAGIAGQRFCTGSPSTVPSFDTAPIDVAFYAPPAPATGADGTFPVIGVFHGYNGVKYGPTSTDVQRWISRGYAVFTMTDRGFRASCGPTGGANTPACAKGYVHLLSNQWEVRDAQYLLGLLADDNAIAPKKIGAVGQSYGSGMSAQLGALKNRIQQGALAGETNGALVPWKSSAGKDMEIAATAPEFGWSDLSYSLVPNGSTLDYAAASPYRGPAGQARRIGVEKAAWTESLFFSPLSSNPPTAYYCGLINPPCNDDRYNLPAIRGALTGNGGALQPDVTTPSPAYEGNTVIENAINELSAFHGSYGTDDSVAPAPAIMSNGWNDDLFPVDEAVRYYNKVREKYPNSPINLWAFDWGHPTRTAINTDNAISLFAAEGRWMDFYIRGIGSAPEDPNGGVNTISSGCTDDTSSAAPTSTAIVHSKSWAALTRGELTLKSDAAQTITAGTAATAPFQTFPTSPTNITVCTTSADTTVTGLANYTVPAETADYTIAGSPTVKVDVTTGNANDALLARLYDVNPAGQGSRRLIARAALRPYGTNPGTNTQVFQLHPQQWKVVTGHTLKLELLAQDTPYIRRTANQSDLTVKNLELRVPTLTAPAGNIKAPAAKIVPAGYTLARDFVTPTPTAPVPTYVVPTPTPTPTPYPPIPGGKVRPGLTLKVKPKRDKSKPFRFTASGKVKRKTAPKGAACRGKVKIKVKKGKKTIGKATAKVKKSCAYKAKVELAKKAGKKGTAKFTARFGGNSVLKSKSVKKSAKYGKAKKKKSKK